MGQRIRRQVEPRLEAKLKAMDHQIDALNRVRDLQYGAIFHEQGLGKTKIAIDLIRYWLEKKQIDVGLVVTKKSLIKNWTDEFETHTHIRPRVISQDRRTNFYVLNSPARVMLTHYEVLRTEKDTLALFLKTRSVAVVLDESTKIKNPDSSLTKAYFALAPLFSKRFIMTGTPIANRPYDLWAQIFFLDQGATLGKDFQSFQSRLDFTPSLSRSTERQSAFEDSLRGLFSKIEKFSVRQTKKGAGLALPEKIYRNIETDWEQHQKELYDRVKVDLKTVVIKGGIPTEDKSDDLLKRMLRLVQIAANPKLIDDSYQGDPGKVEYLIQLLDQIVAKGEKAIVWTNFTENAAWLQRRLKEYGATQVHGKLPIDVRNAHLTKFKEDAATRVLIATPGSSKEGLTLTNANHVIFFDRSFSLDDYLQAQDRIHRISQKRQCNVYNLMMKGSIDEWIEILLQNKMFAAQLAQRDISIEEYREHIRYDFSQIMHRILGLKNSKGDPNED